MFDKVNVDMNSISSYKTIVTSSWTGRQITLVFGRPNTMTLNSTGNMLLVSDFTPTATNATLTLKYDGTMWVEVCRDTNADNLSKDVASIATPLPDINLNTGEDISTITKINSVSVTLNDGTTVDNCAIVWQALPINYVIGVKGVYSLLGTITLPNGITNTKDIVVTQDVVIDSP